MTEEASPPTLFLSCCTFSMYAAVIPFRYRCSLCLSSLFTCHHSFLLGPDFVLRFHYSFPYSAILSVSLFLFSACLSSFTVLHEIFFLLLSLHLFFTENCDHSVGTFYQLGSLLRIKVLKVTHHHPPSPSSYS